MEINTFGTHGILVMGSLCLDFNMNREDIIRMAREAGLDIDSWEPLYEGGLTGFGVYECTHEELEHFAALVASAERERIAKKLEQLPFGDTAASFAIYVREA